MNPHIRKVHDADPDEFQIKTENISQEIIQNGDMISTCPLCNQVFRGTKSNTKILFSVRRHIRSVHKEDPDQFDLQTQLPKHKNDLKTEIADEQSLQEVEKTPVGTLHGEDPDEFEIKTNISDNDNENSPLSQGLTGLSGCISSTCPLCDKVFRGTKSLSSYNVRRHITKVHNADPDEFEIKTKLKTEITDEQPQSPNQEENTPIKSGQYKCNFCQKTFTDISNLTEEPTFTLIQIAKLQTQIQPRAWIF